LKCVLPYFKKNQNGKIVLFASNVTRIGLPNGSAYSASKAGIANIGRTLAAEEAGNNIIINTVSPGPIKIDDSHFSESYRIFREQYYKKKFGKSLLNVAHLLMIYSVCANFYFRRRILILQVKNFLLQVGNSNTSMKKYLLIILVITNSILFCRHQI